MVHELQDSDELSKDLENQKKLVATQQKTIAELEEKLAEKVTKYTELEVRLNKMDKDWQMDRMLHQAAEDLSKQERDLTKTQLQESLEKCVKLEKDHQQTLLEVATIRDRIRNLEAELNLTRQPVSTSNSEEVVELKTKLDDHQKYIARLEEQAKEEEEEEEKIEEPNFQAQAPVETILLDELSEPTNADNQ
uniref:Uncharacterized protein n=1 Tax=Physcomitrium patens TaxID=3218 RepID=A0A2K1KCA6_PHYPA|nr:hypothetical protein PHYPA_010589 [Physcomitrium patens]